MSSDSEASSPSDGGPSRAQRFNLDQPELRDSDMLEVEQLESNAREGQELLSELLANLRDISPKYCPSIND